MWRVWFRHTYAGVEAYCDVPGPFANMAISQAHDEMRAATSHDPLRYWYCRRWLNLGRVVVGDPSPDPWGGAPRMVKDPPLRRRLRVWWRRKRRRPYQGRDALLCGLQYQFTRRHLDRCPLGRRRWR